MLGSAAFILVYLEITVKFLMSHKDKLMSEADIIENIMRKFQHKSFLWNGKLWSQQKEWTTVVSRKTPDES